MKLAAPLPGLCIADVGQGTQSPSLAPHPHPARNQNGGQFLTM